MNIIYIAGLQRSGTTFLQAQLLKYNKVAALGEVGPTINAIRNVEKNVSKLKLKLNQRQESHWNPKTYHILLERIEKDEFWREIKNDIKTAKDMHSALEIVFTSADKKYPNHVLIDSSKKIQHLQKLNEIKVFNNRINVLFSIRDYRGWLFSIKKHRSSINKQKKNHLLEIYKWMFANKRIIKYLNENFKNNYSMVCYDKLIFSHQKMMEKIASLYNLTYIEDRGSEQNFHEILGSQSYKQNADSGNIHYDAEWFAYAGSLFELPVSVFNKNVYHKYAL